MFAVILRVVFAVLIVGAIVFGIQKFPGIDDDYKLMAKWVLFAAVTVYALVQIAALLGVHLF